MTFKARKGIEVGAGKFLVNEQGDVTAREVNEIVNVKAFGAKGDSVTDDSNAVSLAAEHCLQNGGILFFPRGDYRHPTYTIPDTLACLYETGELVQSNRANFKFGTRQPLTNIKKGQAYFDTALNALMVYDGTSWIQFARKNGSETINGNLTVTGDLIVQGDNVILNVAQLEVEDNIITLNRGVTGSPTLDSGIEVNRGSAPKAKVIFDETEDVWKLDNGNGNLSRISHGGAVNVKDFGAKGDGVTDDTAAIQKAILKATDGDTISFPGTDARYKITDTVLIEKKVDVNMEGRFLYAGVKSKPAFKYKQAPTETAAFFRKIKVAVTLETSTTTAEWNDANFVGVQLENLKYCTVEVPFIEGFGVGLKLIADNNGFAWNTILLGRLRDNCKNLVVKSLNGGWPNANNFYNGSFETSSAFSSRVSERVDLKFEESETYSGNSAFFYSPRFEGGKTITAGTKECIVIGKGFSGIRIVEGRFESVTPDTSALVRAVRVPSNDYSSASIKVTGLFTGQNRNVIAEDGMPLLTNDVEVIDLVSETSKERWDSLFFSGNLSDHYYYGLDGGQRFSFDNMQVYSFLNGVIKDNSNINSTDKFDYVNMTVGDPGYNGVAAIKIKCTKGDRFRLKTDGRYLIAGRSTDDNPINLPLGTEILAPRTSYVNRLGGSYYDFVQATSDGYRDAEIIVNSDSIGFIVIGCLKGNSYLDVKKLNSNSKNKIYQKRGITSSTIPSAGTYKAGDSVMNSSPTLGSPTGWICTVAGTPGTWEPIGFVGGQEKQTTLPTASASQRGRTVRIEGATGVADAVYICVKKADDSYDWAQLF